MQQWYAVQTKPRQERVAEENLLRQGYACYCPMITLERRQRKRWTTVTEPLFPRYLFISLDIGNDNFSPIRSTVGVIGMVRFGQEPAVVPDAVISRLKQQENELSNNADQGKNWQPGTSFKIAEGPMAGLEAIYQTQKSDERVIVLLTILGKQTQLSIDKNNLVPA